MNMIEFGDCRETMRKWKEQGIKAQTCVTSPPYYGLRDYGHDGQIGLEETPEEYIAAMVEVFRCVWDVLEDDGTLWVNIGDSYASSGGVSQPDRSHSGNSRGERGSQDSAKNRGGVERPNTINGDIKPKDLIGIPWMLAFALRADGWYLRQDIIWHKPNPMPESVQDRCTKAHEYIFLLSKSSKYYYDHESIKENAVGARGGAPIKARNSEFRQGDVKSVNDGLANGWQPSEDRNKRSVWTVNPKPYAGAHFAVFPTELIEPCIMAGAPLGGVVLDPFMGSGTTAQVAQHLNRQYLGCELNPEYKPLQDKRLRQLSLVLE